MPSFEIIQQVELYLRKRKYRPNATVQTKNAIRRAKPFYIYKGGQLLRKHRGRYLKAVTSNEQVREIMLQFHDNNHHAPQMQMVPKIMSAYYWEHMRQFVKDWVQKCEKCKTRRDQAPEIVKSCLAYGCDTSSFLHPELSFHRFPKLAEQRQRWLLAAQRDEASVRKNSWLCSRHFEPNCFVLEDGKTVLRPDAVPTVIGASRHQAQPSDPDEPLFQASSLEGLLTCAAATAEEGYRAEQTHPPHTEHPYRHEEHQYRHEEHQYMHEEHQYMHEEHQYMHEEHQYSLREPDPHPPDPTGILVPHKNKTFTTYNQIARYLTHRILPESRASQKYVWKMAKRYSIVDGVLMYKLLSRSVRVPRSREEVNSLLQQFHDNRGHPGHRICFDSMVKHYYWATMRRDLHHWISRCSTCVSRAKRKWLRCSVLNCTNFCGPVERKLGLTFHRFPMDQPPVLERWLKASGRPNWFPPLWSSVCSVHFTDNCFDRSGGRVELRPDAVPTVKTHGDEAIQSVDQGQSAADTVEQEETFFSKFDAVELYLSSQTYPPGLNGVEKNTFRRFCKNYSVKDGALYIRRGDRVVSVLRNRAQVNEALKEYHDNFNHLDVKKCLRLLNERCFWKTMRSDIVKWISKCPVCRWKNKLKSSSKRDKGERLRPQQLSAISDPEFDMDVCDENNDSESESETAVKAIQPQPQKKVLTPVQVQTQTGVQRRDQNQVQAQAQARAPNQTSVQTQTQVKTKFKTQVQPQKVQVQPQKVQVQPQQVQVQLQPVQGNPQQVQVEPQIKVLSQVQSSVQTPAQTPVQAPVQTPAQAPIQTKLLILTVNSQPGMPLLLTSALKTATVNLQPGPPLRQQQGSLVIQSSVPDPAPEAQPDKTQPQNKNAKGAPKQTRKRCKAENSPEASPPTNSKHLPTHSSRGRPLKRKVFPDEEGPKKRVRIPDPELTMDLSSKVCPVISADDPQTQTEQPHDQSTDRCRDQRADRCRDQRADRCRDQRADRCRDQRADGCRDQRTDSAPPVAAVRPLEARVVVQQCSRAKVKTRDGADGAEPQFAQIGPGLVVYVCFFEGATEDITHRIGGCRCWSCLGEFCCCLRSP